LPRASRGALSAAGAWKLPCTSLPRPRRRRFPRGALTAYRASAKDKPFYPVDALWFLLQKQKAPHGEYVKECAANAVMPVSLPDRRALLSFLSGATDSSPAIDMTGAPFVQAELVRTAV
jgi:hypothetical protein